MYRRRIFRLDRLVIGAAPEKLSKQADIPAAKVSVPLSAKERAKLFELDTRRTLGPLSPAETYQREQLRSRRAL